MSQIQGFHMSSYLDAQQAGNFPFRLRADLNAGSVSQLADTQMRKTLATQIDSSMDVYQKIASAAILYDQSAIDLNSEKGKAGVQNLLVGDKRYDVFTELKPSSFGACQPIQQAQIREAGSKSDLFNLKTDPAGQITMSLLDPATRQALSVAVDPTWLATVSQG
jgi:hypothetical protein